MYSQGGNPTNTRIPGAFLGWDGTGPTGSLEIRNNFNEPISMFTGGAQRIWINEFKSPTINGHPFARNGYVGIGSNAFNIFSNPALGPFSLLHLNGGNGGFQTAGHHHWMKTGITLTDNSDLAYMGLRRVDNILNLTEFTMTWSNNPTAAAGPDDMCFRFSNNTNGVTAISPNLTANNDGDGLHIARFTGLGYMGMGPTFGVGNPIYVAPQSLMHLSYVNRQSVFTQYTNRNTTVNSGTRETASDGFRIGILGDPTQQRNGNAIIYQQENRHLLLSTRANTTAIDMDNTQERVRITRIGAPTNLPNNAYGQHNPAGLPNNVTRVSISHNPNQPVTRPLSLMHIGYNTGLISLTPGATDGWRNWMDIGTFTSNGTDNMYVGLKREAGAIPANDRHDAVINWGDNNGSNQFNGPDNLRFIFTSTQTGVGDSIAQSNNGLEVGRFYPAADTLGTFGRFGVGDFTASGVNQNPTHKIDVVGNGRFRFLPDSTYIADTLVDKIVMVDSLGVLRWLHKDSLTGTFGSLCGAANPYQLMGNTEVQLNGFDFHFSGNDSIHNNNVGIGTPCFDPLPGKLMVNQDTDTTGSTGIYTINRDDAHASNGSPISLFALATGNDLITGCNTVAGWFEARPSSGQQNIALCVPQNGGVVNIGFATPDLSTPLNEPSICANQLGAGGSIFSINGNGFATGMFMGASDIIFKKNIAPITGALDKVKKLNGVYYDYDNTNNPNLSFSSARQVGLIAQNVDTVLTEVTAFDSTLQAFTMDYSRINALLIEAIKEQDNKVDSLKELTAKQDSINDDLETRLAALEQCINNSNICSSSAKTTNNNSSNGQTVELTNLNAIILDQNLPNPFAENTTITYSIPDDVMEATLMFYDMNGRIIKQMDITDRGESSLTVYGDKLEQGIYTYSLIADGKLIATKKMVKQ